MRALNDIQETIERSLETVFYELLVFHGYLPNRLHFANNPQGYTSALAAIKTTKGFAVNLFGHSTPHDRDLKTVPRIVITGLSFYPGDTGNAIDPQFRSLGAEFEKFIEAPMMSNYRFEITLSSNSTVQDRFLEKIRQAALPNLGYVPVYNDPSQRFLIEYGFPRPNFDPIAGLIEKTYTYEVKDINEQMPEILSSKIAKLKEIKVYESGETSPLITRKSLVIKVDETIGTSESSDTILN